MNSYRSRLIEAFREQRLFAEGYSPLYARIFGIVGGWLAAEARDPLVEWLLAAAQTRPPFDVTLLLPAALHRDVLAGIPEARGLARYYPSAGGRVPESGDAALADALRQTILARADALAGFIERANVQTNETGRGLVWLLPVAALGWPAVHLVELGASAGLNLIAEQRSYRLADVTAPERTLLELGAGMPPQFTALARGRAALPLMPCCPTILSRTGGDMHPFALETADDELTLMAFLWADQVARVDRLREGIAALRAAAATTAPVRLFPLRLPEELPLFLDRHTPRPLDAPLVVFNTTVTMYLPDRGASLAGHLNRWAQVHGAPLLWLQWEPAERVASLSQAYREQGEDHGPDLLPNAAGWLAWTADLWLGPIAHREHHHWQLAWVHPHGTALQWTAQIDAFLSIARHT